MKENKHTIEKAIISNELKTIKKGKETVENFEEHIGRVWALGCADAEQVAEFAVQQSADVQKATETVNNAICNRKSSYFGFKEGFRTRTKRDARLDRLAETATAVSTCATGFGAGVTLLGLSAGQINIAGVATLAAGAACTVASIVAQTVGYAIHDNRVNKAKKALEDEETFAQDINDTLIYKDAGKEFVEDGLMIERQNMLDHIQNHENKLSKFKVNLEKDNPLKRKPAKETKTEELNQ